MPWLLVTWAPETFDLIQFLWRQFEGLNSRPVYLWEACSLVLALPNVISIWWAYMGNLNFCWTQYFTRYGWHWIALHSTPLQIWHNARWTLLISILLQWIRIRISEHEGAMGRKHVPGQAWECNKPMPASCWGESSQLTLEHTGCPSSTRHRSSSFTIIPAHWRWKLRKYKRPPHKNILTGMEPLPVGSGSSN